MIIDGARKRVAVLMTCFNRREFTLACLANLHRQTGLGGCELTIFLVDDGSTDGTSEAVRQRYPDVLLMHGDGSLFWSGGMRTVFAAALEQRFDAYLWLNDDTMLMPDALQRLLTTAGDCLKQHGPAIVAGSVNDPCTGLHTYGGFVMDRSGLRMGLRPVVPHATRATVCDSMNGNVVFIPSEVADALGNLDPTFRHTLSDIDYGLRARAAGFSVIVAPGHFGHCSSNPQTGTWRDRSLPLRLRWQKLMSPKGAPVRQWLLYTRRHYGWRWAMYFLSPYVKTLVTGMIPRRFAS